MKSLQTVIVLFAILSMVTKANAHDIAVKNQDGVTIYYSFNNNHSELAVCYKDKLNGSYADLYSGNIIIPETITYKGTKYNVTAIDDYAFYNCQYLKFVDIPHSVKYIGVSAFEGCVRLSHIIIPIRAKKIGSYAFKGCKALSSLSIPDSVQSVGEWIAMGCYNLKKATIGNGLRHINNYAFYGCKNLNVVIIGRNVNTIGVDIFSRCESLMSVYCYAEKVPTLNYSFDPNTSVYNKVTLYVPPELISFYKNDQAWSSFKKISPTDCKHNTVKYSESNDSKTK